MHKSILTLLLLLTGCAAVTTKTFHNNMPISKKKFTVIGYQEQANSLEYEYYANNIIRIFESKGMIYVTNEDQADYKVSIKYGVDNCKRNFEHLCTGEGVIIDPLFKTHHNTIVIDIVNKQSRKVYETTLISTSFRRSFFKASNCLFKTLNEFFPSDNATEFTVEYSSCRIN